MPWYVIAIALLTLVNTAFAPPPLRFTIDCGSRQSTFRNRKQARPAVEPRIDVASFCELIHDAIPRKGKDGRFLVIEDDQTGFGSETYPVSVAPPKAFIPKLGPRIPRVKITELNVPRLNPFHGLSKPAPRVGFSSIVYREAEAEGSAERMERFKKGVQKMLHVVKVLGQIDQYLSERARIVVDKISKTIAN